MDNLYDFIDLSDVSPELAARVGNEDRNEKVKAFADIVANAPIKKMSIGQVEVVASRLFGADNVPSTATVRAYLNDAVENGWISKPSRQFYAAPGAEVEVEDAEDASEGADGAEAPELDILDSLV